MGMILTCYSSCTICLFYLLQEVGAEIKKIQPNKDEFPCKPHARHIQVAIKTNISWLESAILQMKCTQNVREICWGRVHMSQLATLIFSSLGPPTPPPPKIGLQSFGNRHMSVEKCLSGGMEVYWPMSTSPHILLPHRNGGWHLCVYMHENTSNPLLSRVQVVSTLHGNPPSHSSTLFATIPGFTIVALM